MRGTGVWTRFLILLVVSMGVPSICLASVEPELTMAVRDKNIRKVQTLLLRGADVNERDEGLQQTPLMWAVQVGEPKIVRLLLAHRADVNAIDDEGSTALTFAVKRGDIAIARLLLERGADPYIEDAQGNTALMLAGSKGQKVMVTLIKSTGNKRRKSPERWVQKPTDSPPRRRE
jgi:uncharacterized protein